MQGDTDRLPFITEKDQLPEDQHEHYDHIAESRGRVRGPFGVLLNSPPIAGRIGHLGSYVRFESELSGEEQELIILATARKFDCSFEWVAHEPLAREAGVDDAVIEAVINDGSTDELPEPASLIVEYARSVLRDNAVPTPLFDRAEDYFGTRGITDATATIGYYSMLAYIVNAFEVLPEEGSPPW